MRSAGCVLVLGALFSAACQRANSDAQDGSSSSPGDLAAPPAADLAPHGAGDLAPVAEPDLAPPPETITICPDDQHMDSGTNSVVRVHAAWRIDTTTVSPMSLVVQLGTTPVAGSLSVSGQDLVFTSTAPLPANALLQATLAAGVLDTLGRPLAPAGKTWTFSTGAGALPTVGFKFTPPLCPYLGDHAVSHALARDGSQTIIAWATSAYIVGTSLNADATDFVTPQIVAQSDFGLDIRAVAAADGAATFAFAQTVNSPAAYWSRAQDDWTMPSQVYQLTPDESFAPTVAAAAGGRVAFAWDDGSLDTNYGYVMASSDGGATFSTPKQFDLYAECPQVAYVNGHLVVAWHLEQASGGEILKAMTSTDNGVTFGTPFTLATSSGQLSCPQLVDGGRGDLLVLYQQGSPVDGQSIMLGRYTVATGVVAAPATVYPFDTASQCSYLAASPSGKLVLARSRGMSGGGNWTTELRTSDDFGQTFGAATTPDVIDALGACPSLTITDDDHLTMAWNRDQFQLQVSRGHPRRPCE